MESVTTKHSELVTNTAQKMKFFIKDLVTFTGEILNGKLHFWCNENSYPSQALYKKQQFKTYEIVETIDLLT